MYALTHYLLSCPPTYLLTYLCVALLIYLLVHILIYLLRYSPASDSDLLHHRHRPNF